MHDNGGVQPDDVVAELGHAAPPAFFDVALEFRAQWTVIPKTIKAAINFRGLKNETAPFAQGNDFLHQLGGLWLGHSRQFSPWARVCQDKGWTEPAFRVQTRNLKALQQQ